MTSQSSRKASDGAPAYSPRSKTLKVEQKGRVKARARVTNVWERVMLTKADTISKTAITENGRGNSTDTRNPQTTDKRRKSRKVVNAINAKRRKDAQNLRFKHVSTRLRSVEEPWEPQPDQYRSHLWPIISRDRCSNSAQGSLPPEGQPARKPALGIWNCNSFNGCNLRSPTV